MAHPLTECTTYQLALAVDTLLAERHLLQLNASLASKMAGAGSAFQLWFEGRRDETDAQVTDLVRLALYGNNGSEDDLLDLAHITSVAERITCEAGNMPTIEDLIAAHRDTRALPESHEADEASSHAEDALFAFRPATADQASDRAAYLLSDDALDLSCWGEGDIRALLTSMVR